MLPVFGRAADFNLSLSENTKVSVRSEPDVRHLSSPKGPFSVNEYLNGFQKSASHTDAHRFRPRSQLDVSTLKLLVQLVMLFSALVEKHLTAVKCQRYGSLC